MKRWEPSLQEILDFERDLSCHRPSKQAAIRRRFGLSPARYHLLLNRLIEEPEALWYDPMLVRRLRRLREVRRRKRFAARLDATGWRRIEER